MNLVGLPQQSNSSPGLSFPTAQVRFKGPLCSRFPSPATVPSSGFDYPLDGFLPLNPSEFYCTLTALLGFALQSLVLLARSCNISATQPPHAVILQITRWSDSVMRHCKSRLLGFSPRKKAQSEGDLHLCWPVGSLGLLLFRVLPNTDLDPSLEGSPLMCLARSNAEAPISHTLQSINRPAPGSGK